MFGRNLSHPPRIHRTYSVLASTAAFALLFTVLFTVLLSASALRSAARGAATPDPRATIWTPPAPHYSARLLKTFAILGQSFIDPGLGPMAVDSEGQLYVGDGLQSVIVLSPDLEELRRFEVVQPYALAMNGRGELYIGQRFQGDVKLYSTEGEFVRQFWLQSDAVIETLTAAPDGGLYVMWQTRTPPAITYLTRLDARGNVLFTREFGRPLARTDVIHSMAAAPTGSLDITLSGYGYTGRFWGAYLRYTALGDPITMRVPLPFERLPVAPLALARLPNGDLIVFSAEYVSWYSAGDALLARFIANDFREGGVPVDTFARRAAVAARADGRSVFVGEVRSSGELQLAVIELVDMRTPLPPSNP